MHLSVECCISDVMPETVPVAELAEGWVAVQAGAAGRAESVMLCPAPSTVAVPFPFFTREIVVPNHAFRIVILPSPFAVTVVPFTE
jgi:hypothetical protein